MTSGLIFGSFRPGINFYNLNELSDSTGATKDRIMSPPRRTLSVTAPSNGLTLASAAEWEVVLMKLRGAVNYFSAWDLFKTLPRGTYRGAITTSGTQAAGDTSIVLAGGGASQTFLRGDEFQIGSGVGSQKLTCCGDYTANGSGAVIVSEFEPPLRFATSDAMAVTIDHPLVYYKLVSKGSAWDYSAGRIAVSGFAADFLEQWG